MYEAVNCGLADPETKGVGDCGGGSCFLLVEFEVMNVLNSLSTDEEIEEYEEAHELGSCSWFLILSRPPPA